jgi:hypothetical protein
MADAARSTPPSPNGKLLPLTAAESREVMQRFDAADAMTGPRGLLPEQPDDAVAHTLLSAAGMAIERGDRQKGIAILKLVARDYRRSAEAACARSALDNLCPSR